MDHNNRKENTFNSFKEENFDFSKVPKQTVYCVLAYVYILWIVGLIAERDNETVKFHVNQGIILSAVSFFSLIIINVLSNFLYSIAPILASVSAFLEVLWLIFYVIFTFLGIKNAVKQENRPLPVIGSLFNFVK